MDNSSFIGLPMNINTKYTFQSSQVHVYVVFVLFIYESHYFIYQTTIHGGHMCRDLLWYLEHVEVLYRQTDKPSVQPLQFYSQQYKIAGAPNTELRRDPVIVGFLLLSE